MTSISSSVSMGRQMMDARINQAASAGSISSTDQTALESALNNIDTSLSSSTGTDTSGGDMKTKIDSLIQAQVSSGTLTSDQASELQGFFAQGPGGQGPGGPPPSGADGDDTTTVAATDGTGSTQAAAGTQGAGHMHGHHHVHGGGASSSSDDTTDTDSTDLTATASLFDTDTSTTGIADTSGDPLQIAGVGGVQGMDGPPPPPPQSDAIGGVSGSSASSGTTLDSLVQFLESLKANASATYGADTASAASSSNAGLLINTSV